MDFYIFTVNNSYAILSDILKSAIVNFNILTAWLIHCGYCNYQTASKIIEYCIAYNNIFTSYQKQWSPTAYITCVLGIINFNDKIFAIIKSNLREPTLQLDCDGFLRLIVIDRNALEAVIVERHCPAAQRRQDCLASCGSSNLGQVRGAPGVVSSARRWADTPSKMIFPIMVRSPGKVEEEAWQGSCWASVPLVVIDAGGIAGAGDQRAETLDFVSPMLPSSRHAAGEFAMRLTTSLAVLMAAFATFASAPATAVQKIFVDQAAFDVRFAYESKSGVSQGGYSIFEIDDGVNPVYRIIQIKPTYPYACRFDGILDACTAIPNFDSREESIDWIAFTIGEDIGPINVIFP